MQKKYYKNIKHKKHPVLSVIYLLTGIFIGAVTSAATARTIKRKRRKWAHITRRREDW